MSLPTPGSSRIVFVYINLQSHPLDWSRLLIVNSDLLYMFNWSPCSQICWVWIQLWGDRICLRKILILAPSHRRIHLKKECHVINLLLLSSPYLIVESAGYVIGSVVKAGPKMFWYSVLKFGLGQGYHWRAPRPLCMVGRTMASHSGHSRWNALRSVMTFFSCLRGDWMGSTHLVYSELYWLWVGE